MNNFDFIITEMPQYIFNNPTSLALFPLIIVASFYIFGSITLYNNWQYNRSPKYIRYFFGAIFLHNYFFMPVMFTIILFLIINWIGNHFDSLFDFLIINPYFLGFLIILLFFLLLWMNKNFSNKIINSKFDYKTKIFLGITKMPDLKIVFFSLNYLYLINTTNKLAIFFLIWMDFMVLLSWANLDSMEYQTVKGKIFLKNDKVIEGRLIEQLNDGQVLKVQLKKDKEELGINYVPFSEIKKIEVIEKKNSYK